MHSLSIARRAVDVVDDQDELEPVQAVQSAGVLFVQNERGLGVPHCFWIAGLIEAAGDHADGRVDYFLAAFQGPCSLKILFIYSAPSDKSCAFLKIESLLFSENLSHQALKVKVN